MKLENLKLIKIGVVDANDLLLLAQRTFVDTFARAHTEADMQLYLSKKLNLEQIEKELSQPESEFYFASLNDQNVGYLKVNFGDAQTEKVPGNTLEIERIYVLNDFQGTGVAKLLFDKALEIAKSKMLDFLWLGVWDENPKAIRFYEKNGFVAFDKHVFKLGQAVQTDRMMKLELNGDFS